MVAHEVSSLTLQGGSHPSHTQGRYCLGFHWVTLSYPHVCLSPNSSNLGSVTSCLGDTLTSPPGSVLRSSPETQEDTQHPTLTRKAAHLEAVASPT